MSNVEMLMLLANLSAEGPRLQPRAITPLRRAAWLRYDRARRAPAVVETSRLLAEGFWLDGLVELALAAEALPKAGLAHPLSRETLERAAGEEGDGFSRLSRYLEYAAAFALDQDVPEFLRLQGEAYRTAVRELEDALGDPGWIADVETWFGTAHRSFLPVASLLTPAGFGFGTALATPGGPLAFHVTGPFIEPDGRLTFASPDQAAVSAERELVRAFVKPVLARDPAAARAFLAAFDRARAEFRALGHDNGLACLEDHLVQGIQARLAARRGEAEVSEGLLTFDEQSGYRHARWFSEALEDYELHRADWPTFEAFYPHLMDAFGGLEGEPAHG